MVRSHLPVFRGYQRPKLHTRDTPLGIIDIDWCRRTALIALQTLPARWTTDNRRVNFEPRCVRHSSTFYARRTILFARWKLWKFFAVRINKNLRPERFRLLETVWKRSSPRKPGKFFRSKQILQRYREKYGSGWTQLGNGLSLCELLRITLITLPNVLRQDEVNSRRGGRGPFIMAPFTVLSAHCYCRCYCVLICRPKLHRPDTKDRSVTLTDVETRKHVDNYALGVCRHRRGIRLPRGSFEPATLRFDRVERYLRYRWQRWCNEAPRAVARKKRLIVTLRGCSVHKPRWLRPFTIRDNEAREFRRKFPRNLSGGTNSHRSRRGSRGRSLPTGGGTDRSLKGWPGWREARCN